MAELPGRLRADLTVALRERDRDTARLLRTVLAAIANAEAQPPPDEAPLSLRSAGAIAGAVGGVGAADVPRRDLDVADVRGIVATERNERLATADDLNARGASDAAGALRAEAAVLDRYLD